MIYLDNQPLEVTIFPDKTSQVWRVPEQVLKSLRDEAFLLNRTRITWDFEHEGEIIHLAQLKTLLDREGIYSILHIMTYSVKRLLSFSREPFFYDATSWRCLITILCNICYIFHRCHHCCQ